MIDEKMFTEIDRWKYGIAKAVDKKIKKGELRELKSVECRIDMWKAIKSGTYRIAPPHLAEIPKDDGTMRQVWVNENKDRVLLSVYTDIIFEEMKKHRIHSACKSYQKGLGYGKVVQEVAKILGNGGKGFKADLSKYFDSVPIRYIETEIDYINQFCGHSYTTDVISDYYHSNLCMDLDKNVMEKYLSLKQGSAFAAYLADSVLYDLDEKMSELDGYYVRYSDDLLFVGNDYEKAFELLSNTLEEMEMKLNPKKVEWISSDDWFKFLGFNIKGSMITLSAKRVKNFQKEIYDRTKDANTGIQALNKVNSYLYKGNGMYSWAQQVLAICNCKKDIETLNEFVMDCIRVASIRNRKHTTKMKEIGGLGYQKGADYTITRGCGSRIKTAKERTEKEISGYYSLVCMRNNILTDRALYNAICLQM